MRETVGAVAELAPAHEDGVPAAAIAKRLRIDKSAAWRRLRAARERDYIVNQETQRGRPGRWVIGEPLPEDVPILPIPEALQPDNPSATPDPVETQGEAGTGCTVASVFEGEETAPRSACSRCGTTEAEALIPAHWDDTLQYCSTCCHRLDGEGAIPGADPDTQPVPDNGEAVEQLLAMGTVVGDLIPVDGNALDSYSRWVATEILGVTDEEILRQGEGTHLPYWADPPRWRRPAPTPAPEQAIRLGADAREQYRRGDQIKSKPLRHVWMACDVCGEGVMRKKSDGARPCAITPGCPGKHQPAGSDTQTVERTVDHPARFSKELLPAVAAPLTDWGLPVHDPFGGTGERLGKLCDELGLAFTGTEIEPEFIVDQRVHQGDSTTPGSYPTGEYVVCTSPTYPNGMADHFKASDSSKRNTYRHALQRTRGGIDRELHPNNTGRYNIRRGEQIEAKYWRLANQAVAHWSDRVVVNVKDFYYENDKIYPTVEMWSALLEKHGYEVLDPIPVETPGQRFGANRHRVDTEAVLVAERKARP
jgi:hypothetical protein